MQEAMLLCVDIYKPQCVLSEDLGIINFANTPNLTGMTYKVTPKQMSQRKLSMIWFCKMAHFVIGDNGELE
jgi:hypothetical protein